MTTSKASISRMADSARRNAESNKKKAEDHKGDHRHGQKVIATLSLYDAGQDFTEIDVLENGVILGYSPIFAEGRLTMIGIGSVDGVHYYTFADLKASGFKTKALKGLFIYFKNTGKRDPLPWEAQTFKYEVEKASKPKDADRFCK